MSEKRNFNYSDIEDDSKFNTNTTTKKTTTAVLNINQQLRSKSPQLPWGKFYPTPSTEVNSTPDKIPSEVNSTPGATEVETSEVNFASEVNSTPDKIPSEVNSTSQDIGTWEFFFNELIWYSFKLPITEKEKIFLIAMLSFRRLSLEFSNNALGAFLNIDRSNAGKVVNSLVEKGVISKISMERKMRIISLSPLIQQYLDYKECYTISPEKFYELISTSCEVKFTPDSTLVSLGYIYKENTINLHTNCEKVKKTKLSSSEVTKWKFLLSIFALFDISLNKISQDTFNFIKKLDNTDKILDKFKRSVVYTITNKAVKNPYKYMQASFENEYFTSLEEALYREWLKIYDLSEKNTKSLENYLLEGGKKQIESIGKIFGIKYLSMTETTNKIIKKFECAKSNFTRFQEKFEIEFMTWREELKPQKH